MKIKMCGIRRIEDIEYANILKPDYIGFVFANDSKRFINAKTAIKLREALDSNIKTVGVFVNSPIEEITKTLEIGVIDIVQLHGDEDGDYILELKKKTSIEIIKVFIIGDNHLEDIKFDILNSPADYILIDSGSGSGKTFDWNLLKDIKREYFLAGGLNPNNIERAIKNLSPYGIDVSSGIETNGLKDYKLMKLFIERARRI